MTLLLGCIADDYTGASDLANTLTRCGLRTVQTIGVPSGELALPEVDAVVVSLKSRSIEAGLAVTRSRAAEQWLRRRGAGHVMFKICSTFDSTDAGNIGPVMDALRADSGDAIVLVTPAFPGTGRTVYQGNLFVGANRIRPACQYREIDQPDPGPALARQHPRQVGIVHRVERMILQRAFVERHRADKEVALVDGAAGAGKSRGHQHDRIAGIGWTSQRLPQGPVLIASSATPEQVAALQSRHGRDAAGHAIEQAMADIAEALVRAGVRRLVVAGGETSGAVVDRLQIPGFLVGPEIATGVPVLRAVGASDGAMLLALKSGNFGGPDFFSDALKLMR